MRIWERFTRLDDARSQASGGSGLGLAMVRELAAAHGGSVPVISREPGPGATFLVHLPVTLSGRTEQRADASGIRDDMMDGREAGEPGVC